MTMPANSSLQVQLLAILVCGLLNVRFATQCKKNQRQPGGDEQTSAAPDQGSSHAGPTCQNYTITKENGSWSNTQDHGTTPCIRVTFSPPFNRTDVVFRVKLTYFQNLTGDNNVGHSYVNMTTPDGIKMAYSDLIGGKYPHLSRTYVAAQDSNQSAYQLAATENQMCDQFAANSTSWPPVIKIATKDLNMTFEYSFLDCSDPASTTASAITEGSNLSTFFEVTSFQLQTTNQTISVREASLLLDYTSILEVAVFGLAAVVAVLFVSLGILAYCYSKLRQKVQQRSDDSANEKDSEQQGSSTGLYCAAIPMDEAVVRYEANAEKVSSKVLVEQSDPVDVYAMADEERTVKKETAGGQSPCCSVKDVETKLSASGDDVIVYEKKAMLDLRQLGS